MKIGAVLACVAALGGIGLSVFAFISSSTPYVTVKEALAQPGTSVHVAGNIDHPSSKLDLKSNTFSFVLVDDVGDRLPVTFSKGKPGNFDNAPRASVSGTVSNGLFVATEIKTQCPSKYESETDKK